MSTSINGTTNESLEDVIRAVGNVLSDEDVKHFGLEAEILGTALLFLKENPNENIATALAVGFSDWDV
jgi:hypothetical protein